MISYAVLDAGHKIISVQDERKTIVAWESKEKTGRYDDVTYGPQWIDVKSEDSGEIVRVENDVFVAARYEHKVGKKIVVNLIGEGVLRRQPYDGPGVTIGAILTATANSR